MRRPRRTFSPEFRAKVALAALRGDKTGPPQYSAFDKGFIRRSSDDFLVDEFIVSIFCCHPRLYNLE
jgi:hypothetical protein